MKKKIILIMFILIYALSIANEITIPNETSKMKLVDNKILEKENELEKLRELKIEIQEKKDKMDYPVKVGLVLSGGGAKGMAHIGALRILEEYGIKADYITGTSFGSIVGALYAIGYTPDEIEKIMLDMDWDSFKNDKQDRRYTSVKYKVQKEKYFFNLEMDDDYKLKIPKGVLTGEAFYLELKKLFAPVEGIEDFDDLPIPFRAVSTNVNNGNRNVVGKGDLAKAVFMSMAIPTVFDPIEDNGEYYVDGGLVENLPVVEVIEMGADIVIAVDISAASKTIDKDSNMFEILEKMTSYRGEEQFEKAKKLSDILIIPDVKSHSVADFTGLRGLIEKGEIETKKYEKELREVGKIQAAERKNYSSSKKETVENKVEKSTIKIDEIILTGNKVITEEKIIVLSKKELPAEYTQEEIETWMNKLKAVDVINRFFYTIEDNKLKININENENKYLRIGSNYSDDYGPTLRLATDIKRYGILDNEYMLMLEVSKYPKVEIETIIDYSYKETEYIAFLEAGFTTNPLFIYKKDDKISTYDNYNLYLSGGFGTSIFNTYLLATKFYYIGVKNEYRSGSTDLIDHSSWDYIKNRTLIMADTRDNSYFSNDGVNNRGEFFIGTDLKADGDTEFYGGSYDIHRYIPLNKKFNLELFTSGGKILGDSIPENEYFKIGGLRSIISTNSFSFYGMNAMRKHTDEFYMGGFNLRYKLTSYIYINARYNVITYRDSKHGILDEDVTLGKDYKHGYGVGLGVDSLLGPLEFVFSNDVDASGGLFTIFLGYDF
jgi:NTE family protein